MSATTRDEQIENLIASLPIHVRENYSNESLEQFADLFADIDVDSSQSISVKELKDCFKSLEITIAKDELRALFQNLGTSLENDIEIEFLAFCGILKELSKDTKSRQRFRDNIKHILANKKENRCSKVRKKVWEITDEPSSSPLATFLAYIISFLIIFSTVTNILESDPDVYSRLHTCRPKYESAIVIFDVAESSQECTIYFVLGAVEALCVVVFTVEYGARLATAPDYRKFFFSFFDTIDLLSILPFYVELVFSYLQVESDLTGVLRVFRLVRTLRVLRISRHSVWMQVFITSVAKSRVALATIGAMAGLLVVIFSSLMYNFENNPAYWDPDTNLYVNKESGQPSMFQNIPSTFWWCIITMFLVGFGDEYPTSGLGKLMAVLTASVGMVLLAIPVSVISANFKIQFDKVQRANMRKEDQKILHGQIKQRVFHADRGTKGQSMRELRKRFNETLENMCELNKNRLSYQFRRAQREYRGEIIKSVVDEQDLMFRILEQLQWQDDT